jgi:hypothetical protein
MAAKALFSLAVLRDWDIGTEQLSLRAHRS